MELRHLRYFVAVAEELHFGRAAKRLHLSQPPLSHQIKDLEEELGVELFNRSKRAVSLTRAGAAFLSRARGVLAAAADACEVARRAGLGHAGHLSIGYVHSAAYTMLPAVLRAFRQSHEDVELHLEALPPVEQIKALLTSRLDVGILRPPVNDSELAVDIVRREPFVLALPADHQLCSRSRISLQALSGEPMIMFRREPNAMHMHDLIMTFCANARLNPRVVQVTTTQHALIGLVSSGMGIAIVPQSVSALSLPGVTYRPTVEESPILELALCWRRDNDEPLVQRFRSFVKAHV
ncbi:MAG TPA: LysR substrate-binding domain-containing protein [Microvirga sp.]|jgi:DNA-binding transcriptional LysR family regulator|nr:LysR substrate-binding domain-containing protein [Microvirga sp.]